MAKKSAGGFFSSLYKAQAYLGYFVILRLVVGFFFIQAGWQKFNAGWLNPEGGAAPLKQALQVWINGGKPMPHNWYYDFLNQYVLPNSQLFAMLITLGELAAGGLLVLGLTTRLAGLIVTVMTANFFFATMHLGEVHQLETQMFVLAGVLLMFSAPGRAMGVDWFLYRAFPRSVLW